MGNVGNSTVRIKRNALQASGSEPSWVRVLGKSRCTLEPHCRYNRTCHAGGGVPAPDAGDDDSDDDDDSTVRSRVDGSPSLKRTELQTYDSSASSNAGPLAGGLAIPSAAAKPDDPGQWPHLPCPALPLPCKSVLLYSLME